ncbi:condensation domain-containing protein [Pseudonocardia endophytica]|uniref:Condensation domain-containing protein n=1 Tax=Pseudonocardia endophytica TaxID=401976 RepID=A0A4R1HPH1_PSEEN|nr:condensation domain-containing protein [Pseudonocardia endophytica]TCK22300.1 condensation domain-containing protein [Pseudonocardia endophytica]
MSRTADLCWGQRYHWLRYQSVPPGARHDAHITGSYPLPDGTTLDRLRTMLDYLVRRHEALRTVYDADARPWPQQRVLPPAPLPLSTVTTERDGTETPAEALRMLTVTDFDLGSEWPIRACAATTGGVPVTLHVVFNHLAFDDVGLATLRSEVETLLAAIPDGGPAALDGMPYQPVDLARHESALPASATVPASTHWQAEVAALPTDTLVRRRRTGTGHEAHSVSLTSPALLGIARDIADRAHVWPSAVHLAAYAVTLAGYAGVPRVAHRMYTSQRQASGHASVMTCMSYPTPMVVDLSDDPPFSEVLRRASARVDDSLRHAHVPYDEVVESMACEGERRGQPVRLESELNFLNLAPRPCGTRRDRVTRNAPPRDWALSGSDTYLRVYEWSDGITLMLQAMASVFDADAVEAFLRGYAQLLHTHHDAAADQRVGEATAAMGFAPPGPEPVELGHAAVDVRATTAALAEHAAVHDAAVRVTDHGLVADVRADGPVTPADLRAHVLDAAHRYPGACSPDRFRIGPVDGGGRLEGDGRHRRDAVTPAERALADAVADVNGLDRVDPVDMGRSYPSAGGRVLRAPGVLAALDELGWAGVRLDELTSARPLSTLASRLTRVRGGVPCSTSNA